ncbi:protein Daple-like [Nerophis ophidion]|uniref:protein Daple-like n=1 Tax=Nerophis ophidion TaxID=159077 RepID=UPI002AE0263C|nr:protein Daple-like [Nerophis ophidion]
MDVTLSELLVAFLESPLVLWVRTLGPLGSCDQVGCQEPVNIFIELVDGVFLHNIMTHIDPSPNNHRLNKNVGNDVSLRLHNLTLLTRHIRTYYQDTLQQLIVMPLPNLVCIARDPVSAKSMEELKRLLLLILGCAVQCERKEEMIEKIKLLDMETQASIVSYIQEVTHNQQNVLDLSWLEEGAGLAQEVLEPLSRSMATSLRHLVEQRDMASEVRLQQPSRAHEACRDGRRLAISRKRGIRLANFPSFIFIASCTRDWTLNGVVLSYLSSRDCSCCRSLSRERESDRQRVEDLQEENMLLEIRQKQSMNESAHLGWELEQLSKHQDNCSSDTRKSLVHELNECVSSRVLKLEKENGELQASVERLQEEKHLLQERELHGQVLERENQALSKKVEHLQALLEQEKVTSQDLESLGEELLKDKHLLERQMHLLRADKDRQISEMESKTQNLCDAVASLRERAQTSGQAGVPQVEAENRLLQRRLSDTGARLSSLETEVRLSKEEEVGVSRCDEAERSRDALSMEVATLRACSERSDLLEKEVSSMQQEVLRLTREAEEAQQVQADQQEDLEKLTSSSALLTKQLEEAQTELQEVHRRFEEVEAELQGERKRSQRLEANVATVTQEKFHLKAQVDELKEERDEHAREKKGAWSRLEELKVEVEQLSREQRKREEGDKDRERLQLDLDQSDKTRKHLEKESWRMRMLLDNKEAELEEKARQLAGGQREVLALSRELDRMKEVALKTKEWEQDYKELQKQATMDKRTLATLREELVSEKLSVQQLSVELERLNEELENVGLTRERLLQQEQSLEESKYKLLESRLEETVQEAMKMKEGKLASLQKKVEESNTHNTKVEESNTHNTSLRAELAAALQKGEGPNLQELSKDERRDSATTELLHIKDHLIDVEKNCSLNTI